MAQSATQRLVTEASLSDPESTAGALLSATIDAAVAPKLDATEAGTLYASVDDIGIIAPRERVRQLVASRAPRPVTVMTTPPTVTLSAGAAATAISSGILKAPKRLTLLPGDGAEADMINDPHFAYLGTVSGVASYGMSAPDNVLVSWTGLTGVPTSQVAPWQPRVGFQHTGTKLEILFKGAIATNFYRLKIDGQYATEEFQSLTIPNTGQVYRLLVDFGSVYATREIVVEVDFLRFGGVTIEPTASVSRLSSPPLRIAHIADSIGGGTGEVRRKATAPEIAAAYLGTDLVWNLAVGGTGYINPSVDGQPFSARIATDLPKTDPNVIILFGGYNDRSYAAADVQAAAAAAMAGIVAAKPNALLFVVGCWTAATPGPTEIATNNAVKAAALAAGLPFIDLLDPSGIGGLVADYNPAAQYRVGDFAKYNGALYEAIAFSNAVAFNAANWRGVSLINGTGKVGTTTGNGNADVAIQSDGVHPTIIGARMAGAFIARSIYKHALTMSV